MIPDDDRALVARARAGHFEAFDELVRRHERRLYAIALGIVRRREEAEDVVQTAFLNALEHLGEFREEASFGTWVAHIATNAALKVLRKRRGLDVVSEGDDPDGLPRPEYVADWRDEPAKLLERKELQRVLDEAIDALPERQRIVFVMRDVSGMSVGETARALQISEANVKVRLLRARLALRERLTRVFGDERRRVEPVHGHERSGGVEKP